MKKSRGFFILRLDPRTKILLLFVSNAMLFLNGSTEVAATYAAALALALLLSGCSGAVIAFGAAGAVLYGINSFVLPAAPRALISLFSIFVNYTLKMFPGMMSGALLVLTTSLHDVVLAMRKCRLPQSLIVTLSVTIRYFPAIFEESRHICDAMKLKPIPVYGRIEAFMIPFMMAASAAAEELSAAAVTRGIENPAKKTSILQLRFGPADCAVFPAAVLFIAAAVVL